MVFFRGEKESLTSVNYHAPNPPPPPTPLIFLYNFNIELTFSIEMHHDLINCYSEVTFRSNGVCTL